MSNTPKNPSKLDELTKEKHRLERELKALKRKRPGGKP
jgi:hypothetical protein